jgi:hypothetical protein
MSMSLTLLFILAASVHGNNCALIIKGFTLVNDATKLDISPLKTFIKVSPNDTIAIRADPSPCSGTPKVQSVLVDLDGNDFKFCEVYTPYTIFRNPSTTDVSNDEANYIGYSLPIGVHNVSATPYSGENCTGTAGPKLTQSFSVKKPVECELIIDGFTLVNDTTKLDISPLKSFVKASPNDTIAIRANPKACPGTPTVQSVLVDLDGADFKFCEVYTPYTIFRNPSRTDVANDKANYIGYSLPIGVHNVSATPYSGENCTGMAGPKLTKVFSVKKPNDCMLTINGFTLVNVTTKLDISPLRNFAKATPTEAIAIRADPSPCSGTPKVQSVLVDLDGTDFKFCEVYTPYTIFRNPSKSDVANDKAKYIGYSLSTGYHNVSATPYSGENCTGVAGPKRTRAFIVTSKE